MPGEPRLFWFLKLLLKNSKREGICSLGYQNTLQFYQKYDIDRKNQEISPCIKRNLIYNRIIIQLDLSTEFKKQIIRTFICES